MVSMRIEEISDLNSDSGSEGGTEFSSYDELLSENSSVIVSTQVSPLASVSDFELIPATETNVTGRVRAFQLALNEKRNFIARNQHEILFKFKNQLPVFQPGQWIDFGLKLGNLLKDTRVDIVKDASYFYLEINFPDIHEFNKRIAGIIMESLNKKEVFGSNPKQLQLADHESDTAYQTDLAIVAQQIEKKQHQEHQEQEHAARLLKIEEESKVKVQAALKAEREARQRQKERDELAVKILFTPAIRRKNETFISYVERMISTKYSTLSDELQKLYWRDFMQIVVDGLEKYYLVYDLFSDLIEDIGVLQSHSPGSIRTWFHHKMQKHKKMLSIQYYDRYG